MSKNSHIAGQYEQKFISVFLADLRDTVYVSHLLFINYKYFSKIYILVRVIALLFHCALSIWRACVAALVLNEVCEFRGESQSKSACTSDSKMEIFHGFLTFTDGEYRCIPIN